MTASTFNSNKYDGDRLLSPDEMARRRDARLEQLIQLLAAQHMSGVDVAEALCVSRPTAHDYLRILEANGEAKRTGRRDEFRRDLWTTGAAEETPAGITIVPARQVGMFRHWLDVAFFGPATCGAAA